MQHERKSTRIDLRHFLAFALMSGSLYQCNCEEIVFRAAAKYTPENVLSFGDVAVTSEKKLDIVVLNEGSAGLKILQPTVDGDPQKWRLEVRPDLLTGITPQRTSSISVTYRPCPAAWETRNVNGMMVDLLKEGYDYSTCMTDAVDATTLTVVEIDTLDGGATFALSANPVQPPNASAYCQNGSRLCNATDPNVDPCNAMTFGDVTAGETPCDLVVEIRNTWLNQKAVGELHVEGVSIQVQNIEDEITVDGTTAGFSVVDIDTDLEIAPNPTNPFVVKVNEGEMEGRERFKIRFSGIAAGTWDGRPPRSMTGVKIFTNDPAHPVLTFAINGTGTAADIDWQPSSLNFGPVAQGEVKTLTATITNSGNAPLIITSIGFAVDTAGNELSYTTNRGSMFPIELPPAERMQVFVRYSPTAVGRDSDRLVIINNDINENNRVEIPITGGPVPVLRVDPMDTLVFPEPMAMTPRRESVLLTNIGTGDLDIQRLTITGPQGDPASTSADDFFFDFDTCRGMASCDLSVTLCAQASTSCVGTTDTSIPIGYANNDLSTTDFAELHIFTTDPSNPEHVVVLNAGDSPCFPPQPQIRYEPSTPCKGMPFTAYADGSSPGGPDGMDGIMTEFYWEWLFTPAAAPAFVPPGMISTTITPSDSGVYVLGLKIKNDCGALSPVPASETIMVAETCN